MTAYSSLTKAVSTRVREISPGTHQVWGGIHPIIHPEDAIAGDVDAICTGEGEFAFEEYLDCLESGRDPSAIRNVWTKKGDDVIRNPFLPLMTPEEMERLPFPKYGGAEWIHREGQGFVPVTVDDYLTHMGCAYNAIWSLGCPFHCTFCGNTKFIANDPKYRKLRHPSAKYACDEVNRVRSTFPHISSVIFWDDSFMAIPLAEIEDFAETWRAEVGIPFTVFGVIPNYVKQEKFDILTWAGMNRIRMGIQSGSERTLEFYKRPTPIKKALAAGAVCASFAPKYHIPPTYDFILDNPVETREDLVDTLNFLYEMARPYTLNLYSLKVIPNTQLARDIAEQGIDMEEISSTYNEIRPSWTNILIYLLTFWRPPRWLFDRLLEHVEAPSQEERMHPGFAFVMRFIYLTKRSLAHLRFMEFSALPGRAGYFAWKIGLVTFWQRYLNPRPPHPGLHSVRARQKQRVALESTSSTTAL
jgi:radical SAM superfamily enzyme YgiQ (UPF0313 family)